MPVYKVQNFSPKAFRNDVEGAFSTINASPYKAIAGSTAMITSGAGFGMRLISDGTYWRPMGGRQGIYTKTSTLASPLSRLSGVTAGSFILPTSPFSPVIPGGLIAPNSRVGIHSRFRKNNANSSVNLFLRLGTANSVSDSAFLIITVPNSDKRDIDFYSHAEFGASTTSYSSSNWAQINSSTAINAFTDQSSNVNTSSDMYVSADISSGNINDVYDLLTMQVWIEG